MKTAGPLQKLLHLANAREALRSGDLVQALNEVDAAIASDPAFAAAQTLRAEIVARMNTAVVPECVTVLPAFTPAAVVAVVTEPLVPASIAVTTTLPAVPPPIATQAKPRQRQASSKPTAVPVVLGVLVIAVGVSVVLLASGIISREAEPARPVAVRTTPPKPVPPSDIVLPAPPRAALVATSVAPPAAVASGETRAAAAAIEWASPRLTHLSIRPRWRASALHVDDAALLKDLGQGVGELWVGKLTGNEDAIFVGGRIDEGDWAKLRASIKPTGVVWRIYSNRSSSSARAPIGAATAAGFSRVKNVRYSADFSAEQFALRRGPR